MMFRFACAAPIDCQVAAAFLEAVVPAEIEALAKARKMRRGADEAVCHAQEQQIQRLRYQASLAALPERRVTVHSGDMGYTIGPFARRAKCPGRSVISWMNG
jgi:hypothetical protein